MVARVRRVASRKPPARQPKPGSRVVPDHGDDVDLRGFTPTPLVKRTPRDLGGLHPADTRGTQQGGD